MKSVSFSDEPGLSYKLQTLARHEMMHKLLADIACDMKVCELEGWDVMEFPEMLKSEIDRICELKHARNT